MLLVPNHAATWEKHLSYLQVRSGAWLILTQTVWLGLLGANSKTHICFVFFDIFYISATSTSAPHLLFFLQEWSWTPVKPGARCLNARRCAACSRAPRAGPPLCRVWPVTPSSAPGAEGRGRTAIPAPSASPWCHPHPLMKAGQSGARWLQPHSWGCSSGQNLLLL